MANLENILKTLGPEFEKRAPILDADNRFARENLSALNEAGIYKTLIPKELGGGGSSYSELCYFLKDLAKFCPSTALTLSMHQHLTAVLVFKHLNGDSGATSTLKMVIPTTFPLDLSTMAEPESPWETSQPLAKDHAL